MTNSVCNYGQDSTRPPGPATDRYGDAHTSRFVRPLAGRATLISIDELVLVAQNVRAGAAAASVVGFCRWPRRTAGRGHGSLSRFGDGVDQSVVAALVASGMRRAGSTGRDRVTGIAATTTRRRNGDETETRLGSPAKGRQSPAAAGMDRVCRSNRRTRSSVPQTRGDRPRSQIRRITNENGVCWVLEVQTCANLGRNAPPGADSAGSTAGRRPAVTSARPLTPTIPIPLPTVG